MRNVVLLETRSRADKARLRTGAAGLATGAATAMMSSSLYSELPFSLTARVLKAYVVPDTIESTVVVSVYYIALLV